MKQLANKVVLLILLSISTGLAGIQSVYAQSSSLHDSLKHILSQIKEESKDSIVQEAVKEAQALYETDNIDSPLSKKLLIIDSIMVNGARVNQSITLSYAITLVEFFNELSSKQEHPAYVKSLNNLALLYRNMGLYEKALPLCQQVLAIRQRTLGENHSDYAQTVSDLGLLYWLMGQFEKALPLDQQALTIRKKTLGEQHPAYAQSLNNLAALYYNMGLYEKALPLYQQALAVFKKTLGEEHLHYAQILTNLAALYGVMGLYEKALPLNQQALAIFKKTLGEEHPYYAQSLVNLAISYMKMGQYEKALPLQQKALAILKETLGEEHPEYTQCLTSLANLYMHMSQYEKALPLYQQALTIRKKTTGEEHPEFATCLDDLANLYDDMGQLEKALLLCQQALSIRKKILGEEHPDYAGSLMNLALLYKRMGKYESALPLIQQAISINKKTFGEQHPNYAASLNQLGLLYSTSRNSMGAASLLTQASDIYLRHIRRTYAILSEQEKMNFLNEEAKEFSYLPSLLFTQYSPEPLTLQQLYQNELLLKGMVLEDQQQVLISIRKSGDSAALQLYELWQFTRAFLGKQLLLPINQRISYFDSLQEATIQLEEQLSGRAASFRYLQYNRSITVKTITQSLKKGECAIEFLRFNLYNNKWTDSTLYAALILLAGDSTPHFIPLIEEKQLQRLLKSSLSADTYAQYAAIQKLYEKETKAASGSLQNSLYQLLWKPLEKYLGGIHTIYYAPTGLLHRIAFQALPKDATHSLIDHYHLIQVLSTRSVALQSEKAYKPQSVSLWGNINYNKRLYSPASSSFTPLLQSSGDTSLSPFNFYTADTRGTRGGDWNALPGAKREMGSLAVLFQGAAIPVTIDSGAVATEEAFKALSGKSPQVLHLATHGFFLPLMDKKFKGYEGQNVESYQDMENSGHTFTVQQNPLFRSGLILAGGNHAWKGKPAIAGREDGILTAYEIAQMDLSSTNIVVLSACETALGDVQGNEGVIGLQRAFKLAGVKQLILSLWQVPDKETSELMMLFYRNWLSGQSTREALRNAQLKMKEKYPPYYWAAFVMVE